MEEIWKKVNEWGYKNKYQVSDLGNVKSNNYKRTGREQILKRTKNSEGYESVGFTKNGKTETFTVHRLVADAFIPNPENKPEIDHIDGNPSNNVLSNLRWATAKENSNNPITKRRQKEAQSGENNAMFGRHHSEETKKKISHSVKETLGTATDKKKMKEYLKQLREKRKNSGSLSN